MWPNPQIPSDLVTFTEEILNQKLHLCAVIVVIWRTYTHLTYIGECYIFKSVRSIVSWAKIHHSVVMSCIIKVKDYHYFWGTVKLFKKIKMMI